MSTHTALARTTDATLPALGELQELLDGWGMPELDVDATVRWALERARELVEDVRDPDLLALLAIAPSQRVEPPQVEQYPEAIELETPTEATAEATAHPLLDHAPTPDRDDLARAFASDPATKLSVVDGASKDRFASLATRRSEPRIPRRFDSSPAVEAVTDVGPENPAATEDAPEALEEAEIEELDVEDLEELEELQELQEDSDDATPGDEADPPPTSFLRAPDADPHLAPEGASDVPSADALLDSALHASRLQGQQTSDHPLFDDEDENDVPRPPPPRRDVERFVRPANEPVLELESWETFIEIYRDEIIKGALFVQADRLPQVQSHAIVRLILPDEVGQLRLDGEVVHVVGPDEAAALGMRPGFGLQLAPLSSHARATLEQLVARVQAGDFVRAADALTTLGRNKARRTSNSLRITLSDAESRTLQELKSKLAQVQAADDAEILELPPRPTAAQIRDAFHRLAARWHPSASERFVNPEARHMAMEIFLHLEGAYQRLSLQGARERDEELVTGQTTPSAPVSTEEVATAPIEVGEHTPSGGLELDREDDDSTHRPLSTRRASPFVRRILSQARRASPRSGGGPSTTDAPSAPVQASDERVSEGMKAMAQKRYADAIVSFKEALQARPRDHRRVQVLLYFAEARQLIAEKKLDLAQEKYQQVLAIDPENKMAQKDLLMLSCL